LNDFSTPLLPVAPNPATDQLTVDTRAFDDNTTLRYTITDPRGRLVEQGRLHGRERASIPLTDISTGAYLLRVIDGNGTTAAARFAKW